MVKDDGFQPGPLISGRRRRGGEREEYLAQQRADRQQCGLVGAERIGVCREQHRAQLDRPVGGVSVGAASWQPNGS